jgi:hypothetical protein
MNRLLHFINYIAASLGHTCASATGRLAGKSLINRRKDDALISAIAWVCLGFAGILVMSARKTRLCGVFDLYDLAAARPHISKWINFNVR